jgi:pantoate kinase
MNIIQASGKTCVDSLEMNPTVDHFFELAWKFTRETGLATQRILDAVTKAHRVGHASMCMLGNAVFATGDIQELSHVLARYGQIIHAKSDSNGVRVLDKTTP